MGVGPAREKIRFLGVNFPMIGGNNTRRLILMSITREQATREIEGILADSLERIVRSHGLQVTDIRLLARTRANELWEVDEAGIGSVRHVQHDQVATRTNARTRASMVHLSQLWVVLAAVHEGLGVPTASHTKHSLHHECVHVCIPSTLCAPIGSCGEEDDAA